MYNFFIIFTIIISEIKLKGKRTDFHQASFCERLTYLQRPHYRITNQLQKKIQNGNRSQTIVRKLSIKWKKKRDSLFVGVGTQRVKNNTPP